jgi:16S rRNA (cytosine967-C5)-methyltransferase
LFKRWKSRYGKNEAIALMEWDNQPAETFARINPLVEKAAEIPGTPVAGADGFFRIDGPPPAELLATGALYIQDPATRHAVELLAPQPGERILDACAAPGGKAFLIAAALGSAETLVCTDSNEKRLPRLQANLERLHAGSATIAAHDWTRPAPDEWHASFDAILLDVPCSNTGVVRRRVDVRWRLQPQDIAHITTTQRRILENALPCIKPGGRIVYSTCSIEPEENSQLIESFLTGHPQCELLGTREALPFRDGSDGAYAALIGVKAEASPSNSASADSSVG